MKFGRMKPHRRARLFAVLFVVIAAGGATTFALFALNENINLFYSPEQIVNGEAPRDRTIRAGGMVMAGSVAREKDSLGVTFVISDLKTSEVTVSFEGSLPDLFREGQGVVARGRLNDSGIFVAEEVLAKHDENYMPPEVADVIQEAHADRQKPSPGYGTGTE